MTGVMFWFIVCLMVWSCIARILTIGKTRDPLTAEDVALSSVLNGLILWAIIAHWDWS